MREKRSYQRKKTRFGPKIKWGGGEGVEGKVFGREKREFMSRKIEEK